MRRGPRHTLLTAILTVIPIAGFAEIGCLRLDDHISPTRYNPAWNQYLSTRFEVAQVGLGEIQLRFDDGSGRVVMVLDHEQAEHFRRLAQQLTTSETPGEGEEITFSGWFEQGPRWHPTGPSRAHARLRQHEANDEQGERFELEFRRLVSAESAYTTYQPSTLHFTRSLLTTVAAVIADELPQSPDSSDERRCGQLSLSP